MMRAFCTNCGASLNPETRFCGVCGAPTNEEITRLAARPPAEPGATRARADERAARPASEAEQVVFVARPTLLFVKLGYAAAVVGACLLIVLLALTGLDLSPLIYIPLALALLLIPALYHIKRNTVRYTLTDSKVEIDRGLIARTTRNIPLRNIQDVTVSATAFQRLLGFGDLVIDNASDQEGATHLRNIPDPRRHADLLLRELRRWR